MAPKTDLIGEELSRQSLSTDRDAWGYFFERLCNRLTDTKPSEIGPQVRRRLPGLRREWRRHESKFWKRHQSIEALMSEGAAQ